MSTTVPSTVVTNPTTDFNSTTPTPAVTTLMTTVANTTADVTTEMSTAVLPTVVTSATPKPTTEETTLATTVPITNATIATAPQITELTTTTGPTTITSPTTDIITTNGSTTAVTNSPSIPTAPETTMALIDTTIATTTTTPSPSTPATTSTTIASPTTIITPTTSTATPTPGETHDTGPTPAASTTVATSAETFPATSTAPPQVFDVAMSLELDKQFDAELKDTSSEAFRTLKDQVQPVLNEEYKGLTGFIRVNVDAFSEGSTVIQYTVETTQIQSNEINEVNMKVPDAMSVVAPVIGGVKAYFTDSKSLTIPTLTYTGKSMTLRCGPPPSNINLGEVSGAEWNFKNLSVSGARYSITTNSSNPDSSLTVNQVIIRDNGPYECTLKGTLLNYIQKGSVTAEHIKQAPNIRLDAVINAKCDGTTLTLTCCVQQNFRVTWSLNGVDIPADLSPATGDYCIEHKTEKRCSSQITRTYTCQENTLTEYRKTTTLTLFPETSERLCDKEPYGTGRVGDISVIGCEQSQVGSKKAVCENTGKWKLIEDLCIVEEINELLIESEDLSAEKVPQFVNDLSEAVEEQKEAIAESSNSILAIVEMVDTVSNVSETVTEPIMKNILEVVDELSADEAAASWQILNTNDNNNASSQLLGALELLSEDLEGEFSIITPRITLNRTTFNDSFSADLNSGISIQIFDSQLSNVLITTIAFFSLNNIMPPRDATFNISSLATSNVISTATNSTDNETAPVFSDVINAGVVLIKVNQEINNVTLAYEKRNSNLSEGPRCVFWNFELLDSFGAWDTEGCTFVSDINDTVTCNCSHLTSFSILMSTHVPEHIRKLLDIITYIGVGISLGSLVICLIIEGYVWKAITRNSTALMRHVSIVNTALCLLIADICFIIAASVAKNPLENPDENYEVPVGPCSAATFFMHFFYLALFFWMLVSGMLLFYRTVMVFSHMSKSSMLAIGFCVGYGAPLIIAVITVAVTASRNGYIRKYEACWLNWDETMALLALVIPALSIVFINIIILFVVLYKMLRSGGIGESVQSDEKHTLKVIVRCVLILTPLFGLTWSLGVGTMVAPTNEGIHIAFAFFNSLQGLFILIFGTLFDSKIRAILARKSPTSRSGSSSNRTRSTSGGTLSAILSRLPGRRNVYHLSHASSSSDPVESYSNI